MAQQVRMGVQPDAGRQAGKARLAWLGVDRRAPLAAEHEVQLGRAGWLARFLWVPETRSYALSCKFAQVGMGPR